MPAKVMPARGAATRESGRESPPRVLVVNPSADVYGADLQLLETVSAMTAEGWRVVVVVPEPGELVDLLCERGAEVVIEAFPVLRRAYASVRGILRLAVDVMRAARTMRHVIAAARPDLGLVNTTTLPWWIGAFRVSGLPVVCYVHEAEDADGTMVRRALNSPLLLANRLMVISGAARKTLVESVPWLEKRAVLVPNGVPDVVGDLIPPDLRAAPHRLVMVARVSPRKGIDIALEALALLRAEGRDVTLDICGTPFRGYEWFAQEMRDRSARDDLAGCVRWRGYVSQSTAALENTAVLIAPSRLEPFGNSVVEAQLARRPVVVSDVQGHLETVVDGVTGLHFRSESPADLARAVGELLDDPERALKMGYCGRERAVELFSVSAYRGRVMEVLKPCVHGKAMAWLR